MPRARSFPGFCPCGVHSVKERIELIDVPRNERGLRRQAQSSLADACAAMMANARGVALFVLAALHWYQSHACQPLAMHLSMEC